MKKYLIFDSHAHIFPQKIAQKATQSIGSFYDCSMNHIGSSEELLLSGQRIDVQKYLVCSTATTARQVESINTFIHEQCALHSEFYGFATMHPDYEDIPGELDRAVSLGLHGIKLHPDFQLFHIDDAAAMPIYAAAQERGLPVLFHTGDDRYDYSEPERLRNVALLFPELLCIGAHFGGYRVWRQAVKVLKDLKNVLFDVSSSLPFLPPQEAVEMIRTLGADRFMWGSDFPMWDHEEEFKRFLALPLNEEERERILHGTFEEYLLK